mgnify:CR=1 FL=1
MDFWVAPGILNLTLGFSKIYTPLLFLHAHVHVVHDTFNFLVDALNLTFDSCPVVSLFLSPVLSCDLSPVAFLFTNLLWCFWVWWWINLRHSRIIHTLVSSEPRADLFSQGIELLVCLPLSAYLALPRLIDTGLGVHLVVESLARTFGLCGTFWLLVLVLAFLEYRVLVASAVQLWVSAQRGTLG